MQLLLILLLIPFIVLSIRLLVEKYIISNNDVNYTIATRDFSVLLVCGSTLGLTIWSRKTSITPLIGMENEMISIYLFINIMIVLLEHRLTIEKALLPCYIIAQTWYLTDRFPLINTVLYWMIVFDIFRSIETIALLMKVPPKVLYDKWMKNLWLCESIVLYLKILEFTWSKETIDVSVLLVVAGLILLLGGRLWYIESCFSINRSIQRYPPQLIFSMIDLELLQLETKFVESQRKGVMTLLLTDGENTVPSPSQEKKQERQEKKDDDTLTMPQLEEEPIPQPPPRLPILVISPP